MQTEIKVQRMKCISSSTKISIREEWNVLHPFHFYIKEQVIGVINATQDIVFLFFSERDLNMILIKEPMTIYQYNLLYLS